jgi:hypothetical protein
MPSQFSILKLNDTTYSLKINGNNHKIIYKSIVKINNSTHFDYHANALLINCEQIMPLKKYLFSFKNTKLPYDQTLNLIDDITKQVTYLRSINYGFYGFDLNDILTIDNHFFICNTQYLEPLIDDYFIFDLPIENPYFSSPEIIKLTTLPSEIHYKCSYYSLGILIMFCFMNKYLLVANEIKTTEEIHKIIMPFKNTKIGWFIQRCLDDDINKRALLLI